ncbi:MAG: pyruvate dehydrogenase (acetyl-transferring) E1 component subunit alpha [Chloroflexi bacterium]|nr:pyruvate dehydrogenase (acetyl-transferring) E1 component subunit alpha [Chloroflexota bacterium]
MSQSQEPTDQVTDTELPVRDSGDLANYENDQLIDFYTSMLYVRRFEERVAEMYLRAKIGGYCHLNIGEEATVVGTLKALRKEDYFFGSYRVHGSAIVRELPHGTVMAELFGKRDGCAKGRGGSMHLVDPDRRFMGGYGIVGGSIPLSTGVSFAIKYRDSDEIVMSTFGDGATNIGAFHEALNIASLWKLPNLFICTNNQYGMGTSVARASAVTELWKKGVAYDIPGYKVNGMDVLAVYQLTKKLVEEVRRTSEPIFVECVTYRYRGHSMADAGKNYRTVDEIAEWRERDPVENFRKRLLEGEIFTQEDADDIEEAVLAKVQSAVDFAERSPFPDVADLEKFVYAEDV